MRRLAWKYLVLLAACTPAAAASIYVTPDGPATELVNGTVLSPSSIYRYDAPGNYALQLTVPGAPSLSGIHKMDAAGDWLFSIDEPSDLAGALAGSFATPVDVIRLHAGTFGLFLCGAGAGIPSDSKIDAIVVSGGDGGTLLLSFSDPTTIGPVTYAPSDLVPFTRTGPGCGGWTPGPALSMGAIPPSSNVLDAGGKPGSVLFTLDVPTRLGATDFQPGQIIRTNGATYSLDTTLAGWPKSSLVAGFSTLGNPGRVLSTLTVARSAPHAGQLTLSWQASCSQGAENYAIYEGTLGAWYSHRAIDCSDGPPALTEDITPAPGNTYYLVVPSNGTDEGSYGSSSSGVERPAGSSACLASRVVTPCPP